MWNKKVIYCLNKKYILYLYSNTKITLSAVCFIKTLIQPVIMKNKIKDFEHHACKKFKKKLSQANILMPSNKNECTLQANIDRHQICFRMQAYL